MIAKVFSVKMNIGVNVNATGAIYSKQLLRRRVACPFPTLMCWTLYPSCVCGRGAPSAPTPMPFPSLPVSALFTRCGCVWSGKLKLFGLFSLAEIHIFGVRLGSLCQGTIGSRSLLVITSGPPSGYALA